MMNKKIIILLGFLFTAIAVWAQRPVSEETSYQWDAQDSTWLEITVTTYATDVGEDVFRVLRDTNPIGDTATVQQALLQLAITNQLQLARAYRLTVFSSAIDKIYNDSRTAYEAVSGGEKWEVGTANIIGGQFLGRYRVLSDTSNFFANVVVLQSGANAGRLRMEREDNNDQWLLNPKSPESFQLQGARSYWQSGGTGSIEFIWDFNDTNRPVYRPRDRSLGNNGSLPPSLRIVKIPNQ